MLSVMFFISVFSSIVWLIYAGLFVFNRFETVDMSSIDAHILALYAGLVVIPVWIVWQVFGFINQYFKTKSTDTKLQQLFSQMKKNQDYTDLVVRVMLDAEHEIKDGFVVGKFDVFVADINEILADIVQRANAASTIKIEELWLRVKNGERWSIAKTFIENAKSNPDFETYLKEKAAKDSIFKGTLLEFCARYQNLTALLEKHDRDRVFITILETGVMGKVYSILAPIALGGMTAQTLDPQQDQKTEEAILDVSPEIAFMEAPKDEKTESVLKKLNPFGKKRKKTVKADNDSFDDKQEKDDDEAFFSALQKSMTEDVQTSQTKMPADDDNEPRFEISFQNDEADLQTQNYTQKEIKKHQKESLKKFLNEPVKKQTPQLQTEDNLAYPFGGWTDEESDQQ